jgi:uncharacterized membrane protein
MTPQPVSAQVHADHHHHMEVDPRVHQVELLISYVLRIGVFLSLLVVIIGIGVNFARHPAYFSSHAEMQRLSGAAAVFPHTLKDVFTGVAHGDGSAIIMVGLLLLIATPVLRVAISIFAFAFQRDRIFVIITSIVLILLLVSFFLGKVE